MVKTKAGDVVGTAMPVARCFNTPDAAEYLGVSAGYLEKLRHFGGGPEFIRLGPKCIRYEQVALDEYKRERTHSAVAEYRDDAAA